VTHGSEEISGVGVGPCHADRIIQREVDGELQLSQMEVGHGGQGSKGGGGKPIVVSSCDVMDCLRRRAR
jgi:hypothetical protein